MGANRRRTIDALLILTVSASLIAGLPSQALATGLLPGTDAFETTAASVNFSEIPPIPPGFFGPGSDPFSGIIQLQGNPFSPMISTADTLVERLDTAFLPRPFPATDTIPIELVALSLHSAAPITVTFDGGATSELWDVEVTLPVPGPRPQGSMTITHIKNTGGTFDAVLPVAPRLTFIRPAPPAMVDLDLSPITLAASDVPWMHRVPHDLAVPWGFCPSCLKGKPVLTTLQGTGMTLQVRPPAYTNR